MLEVKDVSEQPSHQNKRWHCSFLQTRDYVETFFIVSMTLCLTSGWDDDDKITGSVGTNPAGNSPGGPARYTK